MTFASMPFGNAIHTQIYTYQKTLEIHIHTDTHTHVRANAYTYKQIAYIHAKQVQQQPHSRTCIILWYGCYPRPVCIYTVELFLCIYNKLIIIVGERGCHRPLHGRVSLPTDARIDGRHVPISPIDTCEDDGPKMAALPVFIYHHLLLIHPFLASSSGNLSGRQPPILPYNTFNHYIQSCIHP